MVECAFFFDVNGYLFESFGAVLLILGLLTRIWAFLIGSIMLVAIYLVHFQWDFYMNWYMQPQTGEGFEYHLFILAIISKKNGLKNTIMGIFSKQLF